MQCALVGSRYFAASVFEALRQEAGIVFTSIVVPAEDDRLAGVVDLLAGRLAGIAEDLKRVEQEEREEQRRL